MNDEAPPAIELRGIEKSFGPARVNKGVSFSVGRGRIAGIVGENGAGKSTLMRILYGLHEADAGEILIDGRPVRMRGPADAIAHGIGMVHQHFMLIDTFTVLENVVLGTEGGPILRRGMAAARAELEGLGRAFGIGIDPDAAVGGLSVGEQQRVEILKVLFRGARVLILDEPSAVLTPQETEALFGILATLKARGVTVVLISHKLREIMAVTDTVHVMRQGEMVAERRTVETSPGELAELMVGHRIRTPTDKADREPGEVVLRAERLALADARGRRVLDGVDLELRAGEIVGVAGVSGNGQSALLEVLSGIRPPGGGRLTIGGTAIDAAHPADPARLRALGVCHVPEDRLRQGIVAPFDAAGTAILGYHRLPPFTRRGMLDHGAAAGHCGRLMERFDVRPARPGLRSGSFSGGNQQKLVMAREMDRAPAILLVGQPTRGVDIGAIELIHRQLLAARDAGCAVLLVSVELDEILSLSDRIVVMAGGRITGAMPASAADERTLGLMMAGAHA